MERRTDMQATLTPTETRDLRALVGVGQPLDQQLVAEQEGSSDRDQSCTDCGGPEDPGILREERDTHAQADNDQRCVGNGENCGPGSTAATP